LPLRQIWLAATWLFDFQVVAICSASLADGDTCWLWRGTTESMKWIWSVPLPNRAMLPASMINADKVKARTVKQFSSCWLQTPWCDLSGRNQKFLGRKSSAVSSSRGNRRCIGKWKAPARDQNPNCRSLRPSAMVWRDAPVAGLQTSGCVTEHFASL
jgi:hypothetical protein